MHNDVTRRTFLAALSASAAGVLTGGLSKLIAAASTSKSEETFLLGGDLLVNRLGFGAMRLTGEGIWGWPPDRENAKKVLRRAVELGVNFIDTADAYGPETNELLIAEALYPYPKGLVIATKGGNTRPGPGQWVPDGRPEYLAQAVNKSLKRLKLERIDLYQLHRIDRKVPVEESLGALKALPTVNFLTVAFSQIYVISICGFSNARSRIKERKCRVVDSVIGGRSAAARVRHRPVDRAAFGRRAPVQRGVALSLALSIGGTRLDPRTLGRKSRTTAAAVLPDHCHRQKGVSCTTRWMAGIRRCNQSHYRNCTCLISRKRSESE